MKKKELIDDTWARLASSAEASEAMVELSEADLELVNGATDVRSGGSCCSVPCFMNSKDLISYPMSRFGTITNTLQFSF